MLTLHSDSDSDDLNKFCCIYPFELEPVSFFSEMIKKFVERHTITVNMVSQMLNQHYNKELHHCVFKYKKKTYVCKEKVTVTAKRMKNNPINTQKNG